MEEKPFMNSISKARNSLNNTWGSIIMHGLYQGGGQYEKFIDQFQTEIFNVS